MPGVDDLVPQRSFARRQFHLIDRRRHGERLESEESFLAVLAAAEAGDRADSRKLDVAQRLAFEIEKLELRAGVLLVLGQDFSVDDAGALKNAFALRNNFLPVGAGGIGGVHHEEMEVGRVFIGGDVNLAAENLAVVVEILAAGEFDGRSSGFQVLQKKLVLAGRALIRQSAAASDHRRRATARPGSLLSCGLRPRSAGPL